MWGLGWEKRTTHDEETVRQTFLEVFINDTFLGSVAMVFPSLHESKTRLIKPNTVKNNFWVSLTRFHVTGCSVSVTNCLKVLRGWASNVIPGWAGNIYFGVCSGKCVQSVCDEVSWYGGGNLVSLTFHCCKKEEMKKKRVKVLRQYLCTDLSYGL